MSEVQKQAQTEIIDPIGSGEIIDLNSLKFQLDYCCNIIETYRLDLNKKIPTQSITNLSQMVQTHLSCLAKVETAIISKESVSLTSLFYCYN